MALVKLDLSPDRTTLRQFGYIALGAFGLLGVWTMYRQALLGFSLSPGFATALGGGLLALAVICGALAFVAPERLKPIYVGMIVVTFPIGFVVSHIILAGLYYLVLTPIGLIMQARGYDPMHRRFEPESSTYWTERKPRTDVRDYFKQY